MINMARILYNSDTSSSTSQFVNHYFNEKQPC
jgi:hypothetical protein